MDIGSVIVGTCRRTNGRRRMFKVESLGTPKPHAGLESITNVHFNSAKQALPQHRLLSERYNEVAGPLKPIDGRHIQLSSSVTWGDER